MPFLNTFVTMEVSECINYEGDCLAQIQAGTAKCNRINKCRHVEVHEKLEVVEIYFDTPTFDKVT